MIKNIFKDLKKKPLAIWLIFVLILLMNGDIFVIRKASDFIFVLLSILWFVINKQFKIDGRVSVAVGLFFLAFCPLFMLFNEYLAMRAGVWAFLLLFCGSILIFVQDKEIKL